MSTPLTLNPKGGYRFLQGIEPYSSGVVAQPGHEIVHVTLSKSMNWHDGLVAARQYLEQSGLDHHALCAVELRCPEPHSIGGFVEFNQQYRALLEEWNIPVDGENPIARTNVAPVEDSPNETVLYGFSYCKPSHTTRPTFVVAGGGELPHRSIDRDRIVRAGETSAAAMLAKAECVVGIMRHRLERLGATDDLISAIDVYTAHALQQPLAEVVMPALPAASRLGVHWFYSRPPVREIEFEMDMRGVRQELVIDLA
jgi:hypothetical protein